MNTAARLDVSAPAGIAVGAALRAFEAGTADFADHLIAQRNRAAGCTSTYSFSGSTDRALQMRKSEWLTGGGQSLRCRRP